MSIQQGVIQSYGYQPDQIGVMLFAGAIRVHWGDPEVQRMALELKDRFLPPNIPNPFQAMATMTPQ